MLIYRGLKELPEEEKQFTQKIKYFNNTNNIFIQKMSKIKEEIKDFVIDKYINIIYKQNKEIELVKKKYEELLKKSSKILKIIITKNMLSNDNVQKNRDVIENNCCTKTKIIKNSSKNGIKNNNNKIKKNKYKLYNNKSICSNSYRNYKSFNRSIDDDKENVNNHNNKSQINIDYLKELNKKDLKKIKFIKQKLLNSSINKNKLNHLEINFHPLKNNIKNKRNDKIRNVVYLKQIKNNSFCYKNINNFNTPKGIKENIKKYKKVNKNNSSNIIRNKINNDTYIIYNKMNNISLNEFFGPNKNEEIIQNKIYHKKFFSINNSFIKND